MIPVDYHIWHDDLLRPAPDQIACDDAMLIDVVEGRRPPTLRLWRSEACLVCPPSHRRLWQAIPDRSGLTAPIFRSTGGGVVALAPGMALWSLAWAASPGEAGSIDEAYRQLADIIIAALSACGLGAGVGEVSEAMCRGRYDLTVGTRKIAGLSQRRISRRSAGEPVLGILVHAFVLVDPDLAAIAAACNGLAARLGVPGTDRSALTSIAEIMGRRGARLEPVRAGAAL